jgi:hypothetical protein
MADRPNPLEDAFVVAVGAVVLGYNRLQVLRRRLEEWIDEAGVDLDENRDRPAGTG